jgi:hypothetical protein
MFIMEFKRMFLIVCVIISAFVANAQDNYFVYLQTENNQPFYARINNKVVSSTTSGYLILPKLKEGKYDVKIGFPRTEFEETFSISVENKSEGYLIKNLGEKGWSLFNLQTLALLNPITSQTTTAAVAVDTGIKEDPFSQMLASVLKDSSLLKKNTPVELPAIQVAVEKESNNEKLESEEKVKLESEEKMVAVVTEEKPSKDSVSTENKSEDSKSNQTEAKSIITYNQDGKEVSAPVKILGVRGREGSEMIYVDKGLNTSDTIRVFIPKEKESGNSEKIIREVVKAPEVKKTDFTITPTVITPVKEAIKETVLPVKEELKSNPVVIADEEVKKPASQVFIIRDDSVPKEKENGKESSLILVPSVSTKTTNSDCKDLANNNDFLKIRKRMAAEKDNDAMVFAAKKFFKTKCFSTEQIRNLSFLFLNDEGRYMFFDAAYPYTSDSERYPTLLSQLKDEYYINRFNALIQK